MAKKKSLDQGPIRVAVIGLGRAGWSIHVVGLKGRSDYKIVACVDAVPERRKEAEETLGCRTYADWKSFIKDPGDTELVIIATATDTHTALSIEALSKGLHVLVEKPMSVDLKEATKMMRAVKKSKTVFTVNQSLRCNADLHQMIAVMNSGILGKVYYIKLTRSQFARRNDWQTLKKYGGGNLNNTGAHLIDFAMQLMQAPVVDVWGDLQAIACAGDTEDHVKIMLRGKNGRVIDIETSNAIKLEQPMYVLCGSLGTAVSEKDELVIKYLDPKTLPKLKLDAQLAVPGRKYGVVGGEVLHWMEKRLPARPAEMKVDFYAELYQSIREGKKLFVKPEEVYEQMKINAKTRKGTKFS